MPKPVTVFDSVVRLRADMSDPNMNELLVPQHFTNIQHGLKLSRQLLAAQDTPNRRVILITDGLPTAHFEDQLLYLLYPPDRRTEEATLREGNFCRREGITVTIPRRRPIRLPPRRIDPRQSLLHRRPRSRPLCIVGLSEPPAGNCGVVDHA
jgi:hypothetical protein